MEEYRNKLSLSNKLGRALWFLVYWTLFRPFHGRLFKSWRNLILNLFGAKIKGNSYVSASVKIWAPWNLEMESACISYSTRLYNVDRIILKKGTVISHNAHLCSASHDIYSSNHELITKPIVIEDQVWVATEAFVGPGVHIKQGAVVGARAVVTKDVEPWCVVAGNPGIVVRKRKIRA